MVIGWKGMINENLRFVVKEKMIDIYCIYIFFIFWEILCKIFVVLSY